MGRHKGTFKTGGRKQGTVNKRTDQLLSLLQEFNYDPARSILLKYPTLTQSDQLKIDLKLLEHVYPKLKEQSEEADSSYDSTPYENMTSKERQARITELLERRSKEFGA